MADFTPLVNHLIMGGDGSVEQHNALYQLLIYNSPGVTDMCASLHNGADFTAAVRQALPHVINATTTYFNDANELAVDATATLTSRDHMAKMLTSRAAITVAVMLVCAFLAFGILLVIALFCIACKLSFIKARLGNKATPAAIHAADTLTPNGVFHCNPNISDRLMNPKKTNTDDDDTSAAADAAAEEEAEEASPLAKRERLRQFFAEQERAEVRRDHHYLSKHHHVSFVLTARSSSSPLTCAQAAAAALEEAESARMARQLKAEAGRRLRAEREARARAQAQAEEEERRRRATPAEQQYASSRGGGMCHECGVRHVFAFTHLLLLLMSILTHALLSPHTLLPLSLFAGRPGWRSLLYIMRGTRGWRLLCERRPPRLIRNAATTAR